MGQGLSNSLTEEPFAALTDVTLADKDTNSILTDKANRAIQGNVRIQVAPSGAKFITYASGAIWWANLQLVQLL